MLAFIPYQCILGIGALRAAELSAFGMHGVGMIYRWYRDGILQDDDEVAIAHGTAETGFRAASEAMVNIRQTLRKAESLRIISSNGRKTLERLSKELFYPHRTYRALIKCAHDSGLAETELAKLADWLPEGRVDQKRDDALAMLRTMRKRLGRGLKQNRVSYFFEHTAAWELARKHAAACAIEEKR